MKNKIILLIIILLFISSCRQQGGPGTSGNGDGYPGAQNGTPSDNMASSFLKQFYYSFSENYSCLLDNKTTFFYKYSLSSNATSGFNLNSDGCTNNKIAEVNPPYTDLLFSDDIENFPKLIYYKNSIFEKRANQPLPGLIDETYVKYWCYNENYVVYISKKLFHENYQLFYFSKKTNSKKISEVSIATNNELLVFQLDNMSISINEKDAGSCILKTKDTEETLILLTSKT